MKEIGIVTKNNNFNPNETFFGEKGQYFNLITRFPEDYHQYFDRGKCILRICSVNVTRQVLIFWGKATLYKCTKEKLRVDCNGKKSQNTWNHSSVGGGKSRQHSLPTDFCVLKRSSGRLPLKRSFTMFENPSKCLIF